MDHEWPSPTAAQQKMWEKFVMLEDGADDDGWYMGHCPIHAPRSRSQTPSAMYNFRSGVLRCLAEPRCHEKRAMSLTNAALRMKDPGE